ncbi:MAG: hypothetical protein RL885_22780 [Planctomycetota bacterium]
MDSKGRVCAKCGDDVNTQAVLERSATLWDQWCFCETCSMELRVLLETYPGLRSEISMPPLDRMTSEPSSKEVKGRIGRFFGLFG